MPRPRFERLDPEVQARILDAAEAEFAAHGADKASFNRIIAAAGISKGAIYYYFDDKEDLFLTVVRRASLSLAGEVGGLADGEVPEGGFWVGVDELIRRMWTLSMEDPTRLALLQAAAKVGFTHGRSSAMDALMADVMGWMDAILDVGEAAGEVRTDVPRALLVHLLFGVGEALDRWCLDEIMAVGDPLDPALMDRLIARYVDTMRRLVAP